ncbi:hypothetical protein [Stenotrophomonas maltophilia]|uniref:hypothetical protein n=1 Tax=Stenotrophomonas maltophilia TaxID=40324 RepID=UPI0015DD4E4E|nr:hypothetical protein [Stenotrophomonas maltophilia]BBQ11059.1 hypothetical protein WP1W18C01_14190 [Stenotrophomonas maltophilia]
MTPEEKNQRILQRKRKELLERAKATPTASPTQEERLVSDGVKENLKAAGHWAGVISKRTAELTQKGVVAAAEKAKQAKAQLDAKRTREAQEHSAVEEKPQDAPLTVEQEMLVRQLTSDAAAPVLVGAGDKGMCTVWELVDEFGEPGAQVADGLGGANNLVPDPGAVTSLTKLELGSEQFLFGETGAGMTSNDLLASGGVVSDGMDGLRGAAKEALDANSTIHVPAALAGEGAAPLADLSQQDVVDTLSVSAVPEGSSQPPHAASVEQPVTPIQPSPRSRLPWVLAGVVAVALVAGAIYFLLGKNNQVPPSTPAPASPVATPAAPEQLPEVVEVPVVAPAPAVLSEQAKPEATIERPAPVAAPPVTTTAPIAPQPMPSPKRATAPLPKKAPAPAAEPRHDWQQEANADLDAWAKKSGID